MRTLFILACLLATLTPLKAQETPLYQRIKFDNTPGNLAVLKASAIAPEHCFLTPDDSIYTELSLDEVTCLANAGLHFRIVIENLSNYYANRSQNVDPLSLKAVAATNGLTPVPEGFSLGTMGGFSTHGQLMAHLDTMASRFPDLISQRAPISAILTHENHNIFYVKISDNPYQNEDEPAVLFTGLTHAREPIGMQQMLFFMYHLLENYTVDPYLKALIDTTEIYFIPCVNPDGYIYNQQTNPGGGGLWRKNRLDHGDGTYGVDLNRNFGYMWGYDDEGSSPYTWSETYRGAEAFSEPETKAIRDFVNEHQFSVCLNYHSYGNLLLYPFGYEQLETPDSITFHDFASRMTAFTGYSTGTAGQLLYNTNGDANDWMYGDNTLHPAIISMTPEVGNSSSDGFWPAPERIIPLCQENVPANLHVIELAGTYGETTDLCPMYLSSNQGYMKFMFVRNGLKPGGTYTVEYRASGNVPIEFGAPKLFTNPARYDTLVDSISYTLATNLVMPNQPVEFVVLVSDGHITRADTLRKIIGTPLTEIFNDDGSTMDNWLSTTWNTTNFYAHSPSTSITDSPIGNYPSNTTRTLELKNQLMVDPYKNPFAMLSFWTRRSLQRGRDFVVMEATTDNGVSWKPLKGRLTHEGGPYQQLDTPVYDGFQDEWILEEVNLFDVAQYNNLRLRFTLKSDALINRDGFWFDDLKVYTRDWYLGDDSKQWPGSDNPLIIWPNPTAGRVQISIAGIGSHGSNIEIQNMLGQVVMTAIMPDKQPFSLPLYQLQKGIYLVILHDGQSQQRYVQRLIVN